VKHHKPTHECGVFAIYGHPNAAVLTYYGLFALQHRGQESAGIVTARRTEHAVHPARRYGSGLAGFLRG
jgi:glutamine phosphoribosylpyrophosphate amidotransferase